MANAAIHDHASAGIDVLRIKTSLGGDGDTVAITRAPYPVIKYRVSRHVPGFQKWGCMILFYQRPLATISSVSGK
jgi:hypothetical protein